jgi:hypothetical protein
LRTDDANAVLRRAVLAKPKEGPRGQSLTMVALGG